MIFKSSVDKILIQGVLKIISQGQGENNPKANSTIFCSPNLPGNQPCCKKIDVAKTLRNKSLHI